MLLKNLLKTLLWEASFPSRNAAICVHYCLCCKNVFDISIQSLSYLIAAQKRSHETQESLNILLSTVLYYNALKSINIFCLLTRFVNTNCANPTSATLETSALVSRSILILVSNTIQEQESTAWTSMLSLDALVSQYHIH